MHHLTKSVQLISLLLLFSSFCVAQIRDCGVDTMDDDIVDASSFLHQSNLEFESKYQALIKSGDTLDVETSMFLGLPIVFHIVHEGDSLGNSSNPRVEHIHDLIEKTNNYFRQHNEEQNTFDNPYYGADTKISFCLASRDESGNPISGINRYVSSDISIPYLTNLIWDTEKYINVFLLNDFDANICGTYSSGSDIIRLANRCGSQSLLAHELGHYLDLKHTFLVEGDCINSDCTKLGDLVCDTPPKFDSQTKTLEGFENQACLYPGNSCHTDEDDSSMHNPYRSISLGGLGEQPDPNSNIMGYTNHCSNNFTLGQATRMHMNLLEKRRKLWMQDTHCNETIVFSNDAGIDKIWFESDMECNSEIDIFANLINLGVSTLRSAKIRVFINNRLTSVTDWEGSIKPRESLALQLDNASLGVGRNKIIVEAYLPNNSLDQDIASDINYLDISVFNSSEDFDFLMKDEFVCSGKAHTLGVINNDSLANFNFLWSRKNGIISNELNKLPQLKVNITDTYYLTIYNAGYNCNMQFSADIKFANNELDAPLKIESELSALSCNNSSTVLKPNYLPAGASIKWFLEDSERGDGFEHRASKPGKYRFAAIYETEQCAEIYEYSDWFTVTELEEFEFELTTSGNLNCEKDSSTIWCSLTNLDRYELRWSLGNLKFDPVQHPNYFVEEDPRVLKVFSSGYYKLEITDKWTGCNSTDLIEVENETDLPDIRLAHYSRTDSIQEIILFSSVDFEDYEQEYEYEWKAESGGEIIEIRDERIAIAKGFGVYSYKLRNDSTGCESKSIVPLLPSNIIGYDVSCQVDSNGVQYPTINAFVEQDIYLYTGLGGDVDWYNENGDFLATGSDILIYEPGIYRAEIFNFDRTYSIIKEVDIPESAFFIPTAFVDSIDSISCKDEEIVLVGDKSDVGFNFEALWKNENREVIADNLNALIQEEGRYYLEIINLENGCFSTAEIELYSHLYEAEAGENKVLECPNYEVQLGENKVVDGYSFAWSKIENADTMFLANEPTIKINAPGSYLLEVINEVENCSTIDIVEVFDAQGFIQITEIGESNVCADSILLLSLQNLEDYFDYELIWTFPDGSQQDLPIILAPEEGEYTVQFLDHRTGCEQRDAFHFYPNLSIDIELLENGLSVKYKGGVAPYSYLWNTGEVTEEILNLKDGEQYEVTVTDANNCSVIESAVYAEMFPLTINPKPSDLTISPNPTNGKVNIAFDGDDKFDLSLSLFNAAGQEIIQAEYAKIQKEFHFDLGDYPAGVYIFVLEKDNKRTHHKIIVTQ